MKYNNILKGKFILRPNRFIAYVEIDGNEEVCHVKNTGRCKELLIPNATVFIQKNDNPKRKTKFSLIGVVKGDRMINMDSQVTNKVVHEWILKGNLLKDVTLIKPEAKYKNSRFDFYVETKHKKIFIEVKGVTLENNGIVKFPDAPTERGVKHLRELIDCIKEGYDAYVIFVIQMKEVVHFEPNVETHKEFGDTLKYAKENGVNIVAVDCLVDEDSINIRDYVDVIL
ncbi:DNA/RNA nuclease SfsA [Clostridium beijerinckii]|jgi:sugar fermentation stimulation protein A|uniref:Sugar fermentation stimulation protein homolog n=2 Tax=Clostridium beijerinckii TaxID=1520 RepID=SFSA_CLOB8|nr:DNA/RNA nuclease SfsA [Clostridium beijerinckii]A6LQQ3.1 RecName: Full=Sugar fermentation stimulation protein homolog [Clostridium beijerinckii NCIMB 8052]ABR32683.1 sugar fermentation stimulation protein [Clostridium beijerinckii NCIMB 8052]AIU04049.1 sugar fermentation stimulation protein A [Clostridium beijerinckii ATCC 35702]MBF7807637.1 DNA/RNA nuclease SfsA [Clostridium beijerinckii]NRT26084.1 sugar fermentation stimulation protein A [Clostridium beijerinckii]NRT66315.1 sugar ferment